MQPLSGYALKTMPNSVCSDHGVQHECVLISAEDLNTLDIEIRALEYELSLPDETPYGGSDLWKAYVGGGITATIILLLLPL